MTEWATGTVGERAISALSATARADWDLFTDWCTATGRTPTASTWADLSTFLAEIPASMAIQQRRLRHIQTVLEQEPTGLPRPLVVATARPGPQWLTYPEAMTALRHEWHPEGVAARRDALILTLAAHGFTRKRIRRLRPQQTTIFPEPVVDSFSLPRHRDPALCPRCALTRWLAVLDAYRHRSGRDIEDLLTDARTHSTLHPAHDCLTTDLTEGWRHAPWLICPIDRHGALTPDRPVTRRALTAIFTRRFIPPENQPQPLAKPGVVPEIPDAIGRRLGRDDRHELDGLYTKLEDATDALTARIADLLREIESY